MIYGLACADALGSRRVPEAVAAMARAGLPWIQLRLKDSADGGSLDDRGRCAVIERSLERLGAERERVVLWMDDRADLARLFDLDGVHVGQRDLEPSAARRVVGDALRIGLSCHDLEQVRAADADPAVDVVAIGPVFATRSKAAPDPVVGLEGVTTARGATRKTLVAIGGLDERTAGDALAAGADFAAVLGALCARAAEGDDGAATIEGRARRLLEAVGTRSAARAGERA